MKYTNSLICFMIDDEAEAHRLFTIALEDSGIPMTCYHYYSASKALEQLRGSIYPMPDLVFIDVMMPGISGIDFLKEIKAIQRLKNIAVYMYSGDNFSTA